MIIILVSISEYFSTHRGLGSKEIRRRENKANKINSVKIETTVPLGVGPVVSSFILWDEHLCNIP
jgi:hypothetical protein